MDRRFARIWRKIDAIGLFRACLLTSVLVHAAAYSVYHIVMMPRAAVSSEDIKLQDVEVDFEDFPPELIGGTTRPAPVEKQEWVEGTSKTAEDALEEEINLSALSGDGTDKDGYLFSFNGDRPPTPIINFDLRAFFPREAKEANITRKTVVLLIQVEADGTLKSAKLLSERAGYGFDEAALKIVHMARFAPGYVKGRPTRMVHKLPITFVLEEW